MTEDAEAERARALTHGQVCYLQLPAARPDGPTRTLATIVDPEGNPIGLAAHTPQ